MKAKFSMKDDPATLAEILEYGKQIGIKQLWDFLDLEKRTKAD